MLEDGTYEAIVVEAEDGPTPGSVVLHLAVAAGANRGQVVTVTATGLDVVPLDVLAVPATVVVHDGSPVVTLER